jgi:hypothetical protein
MDQQPRNSLTTSHSNSRRAGCVETRKSGSGGGPQKRAGRKVSTALWAYLT